MNKELENAKQDRLKDKPTHREPSDKENYLKEQINHEKLRIKLNNLQADLVDKKGNKFTPQEAKDIWDYMKGKYIENGTSYRDALSFTSQDLGLTWRQVSEAITTPKNQRIENALWKKQADLTMNRMVTKRWIADQNKSVGWKVWKRVSGLFRGEAVIGHGAIFVGTHAGPTLFHLRTAHYTVRAFLNGWKFAYGNEGNYNRAMEELKNNPNFVIAERGGLKNNPEHTDAEEYQRSQKWLGRFGLIGVRGFNAIKVLRQNLFDNAYNRLSPAEKADPEVINGLCDIFNRATNAKTSRKPPGDVEDIFNEVTFAGGMEIARWQKLFRSPARATGFALNAIFKPENATVADRVFAKVWAGRVGGILAGYSMGLLANAAIQNTLNPKNPVNLTHPDKPDFLKYKFGDITIDLTSGMRAACMFVYELAKIAGESKKEAGGSRGKAYEKEIGGYARGKLAPVYSTIADFATGEDFNKNVMPGRHDKPGKNAHKLSWGEYGWEKAPLPVAEAAKVTYDAAIEHGANKVTLNAILKGIRSGAISGSTGFRVGEYDANSPKNKHTKAW